MYKHKTHTHSHVRNYRASLNTEYFGFFSESTGTFWLLCYCHTPHTNTVTFGIIWVNWQRVCRYLLYLKQYSSQIRFERIAFENPAALAATDRKIPFSMGKPTHTQSPFNLI